MAGANYVFCATRPARRRRTVKTTFEKTAKTKADIIKALSESIAYCDAKYNALTDASGAKMMRSPYGMGKNRCRLSADR